MTSNTEPTATRWNHTPATWAKREYFTDLLETACEQKEIRLSWLDGEKWAGVLMDSDGASAPIFGYDLGLNPSAAAKIADSKVDSYVLLKQKEVPAIRHDRLSPNLTNGQKIGAAALAAIAVEAVGLPLVAKPDALASGGKGVMLCSDETESFKAINALTKYGAPAAVSPYTDFTEHRAIVLGGNVHAVIEKRKQPGGWMHNHSQGAEHILMRSATDLYHKVGALGVRAADALDLVFASVDIAEIHEEGSLAVLEVNDVVSIAYPESSELEDVALRVYGEAARMRLARQ